MTQISRRGVLLGSLAVPVLGMGRMAWAQSGEVTISHYFTGELGLKAFNEQVAKFTEATGIAALTISTLGVIATSEIGAKSFAAS